MIRRTIKLNLAQGLHLRACMQVAALAAASGGELRIQNGDRIADARSITDLIQLVALPESLLIIEGDGEGSEAVLDAIEQLLSQTALSDDEP